MAATPPASPVRYETSVEQPDAVEAETYDMSARFRSEQNVQAIAEPADLGSFR